jgi:hypothetical protein
MEETSFFNILINSLAFPFKDPDWLKKSAIGFALVLAMYVIPIVPMLFIAGYGSRIMKRILVEEGKPYLPEWDNWEGLLTDGVKLWGAGIIYALPILLLLFLGFGLMLLAILSPLLIVRSDGSTNPQGWLYLTGVFVLPFLVIIVLSLVGMIVGLLQAAGTSHMITKGNFSAAFVFSEWWPVFKKGFWGFLLAFVILMALSFVTTFVVQLLGLTIILIFVLPFLFGFITFFTTIYGYTFHALAYRQGMRKIEEAKK